MRIIVAGGAGQLGRALVRRERAHGNHDVIALDRHALDITNDASILQALSLGADCVINAAAYTAVDRAETDAERAFAVNAEGPGKLGDHCMDKAIQLIHVSTDYVFDGTANVPYSESAPTSPTSVYGASKRQGEMAATIATERFVLIVRTSWLFESKGPSFVHTILRLAQERPVLRVVADQIGCPTWADDLADALLDLAARRAMGHTLHYCNDGITSWHGFAEAIVEEARKHRPNLPCERVEAITTAEFPTVAKRPAYSVLDTSRIRALGITPPPWRPGLAQVVAEILRS